MKLKLILIPFIFFIVSCSKEDGHIEGTILDEYFNTPLKNVGLTLVSVRKTGGKQQFEKSGISDNDGHYKINYNYSSTKIYQLQFHSPSNGGKTIEISSKKTTFDLILPAISNLQYRLKNNRTNEIQVSISGEELLPFHTYILKCSLKAKADSIIPYTISVNGFGKTVLSYSIISTQQPLQIIHDTISIFTKTDTLVHLIEIN